MCVNLLRQRRILPSSDDLDESPQRKQRRTWDVRAQNDYSYYIISQITLVYNTSAHTDLAVVDHDGLTRLGDDGGIEGELGAVNRHGGE